MAVVAVAVVAVAVGVLVAAVWVAAVVVGVWVAAVLVAAVVVDVLVAAVVVSVWVAAVVVDVLVAAVVVAHTSVSSHGPGAVHTAPPQRASKQVPPCRKAATPHPTPHRARVCVCACVHVRVCVCVCALRPAPRAPRPAPRAPRPAPPLRTSVGAVDVAQVPRGGLARSRPVPLLVCAVGLNSRRHRVVAAGAVLCARAQRNATARVAGGSTQVQQGPGCRG